MNQATTDQLDRLLGFLSVDPDNPSLLIDAIETALAVPALDVAQRLIAQLAEVRPGSFEAGYFAATLAMIERDFATAAELLTPLVAAGAPPNARFNLSWSLAMQGEKSAALDLLDAETTGLIPSAAMLRTQLLHEAGEFEAALEFGSAALEQYPDDAGLNSAIATLALDLEDEALARACAARGGDHPEALAAAGVLDLQDGDSAAARTRFDRSIAIREHNPRAWVGRGLTRLVENDPAAAAQDIDRGAQQFGDHIGSWIAAGFAHFLAGDIPAAAQRFERAYAIDPNFAESHGSLAVIDAARGDRDSALRRIEVALRLDRQCFSAVLAKIMIDAESPEAARALIEQAFNTPLNQAGITVSSYMAGLARPTMH